MSISRSLLCEGFDATLVPEVGWVQQGTKVCFLLGHRDLCESQLAEGTQIVESIDQLELVERESGGRTIKTVKDGRWFVEGPFQRSDVKNANKRVYPRGIWERLIANPKSPVQESVGAGMLGHLEHPADGRTDGKQGALATRKLTLRPDGVVWGVAELLDTPNGLILQEYTRKGVRWGVSSRGNGSVDETGRVNETDYSLEAFDGVMKPSTPGAYPKATSDSRTQEAAGAATASPISEDVTALRRDLVALCETDLAGLASKDRLALARSLVSSATRLNSLVSSQVLPYKDAAELQDWLMAKLRAVHESVETEQVVETAVRQVESGDDDEAAQAFKRVVESLQARLEASVRECAGLRTELRQTQRAKVAVEAAATQRLERILAEQTSARTRDTERGVTVAAGTDAVQRQLAEAQATLAQRERELAIARALVADTSATTVRNPVADAVAEALDAHPSLVEFQAALQGAESPEQVAQLVERLIPPAPRTPTLSLARRSLPTGAMVESTADAGKRSLSTNPSPGAKLAGAVVKRMHVQPSPAGAS